MLSVGINDEELKETGQGHNYNNYKGTYSMSESDSN